MVERECPTDLVREIEGGEQGAAQSSLLQRMVVNDWLLAQAAGEEGV